MQATSKYSIVVQYSIVLLVAIDIDIDMLIVFICCFEVACVVVPTRPTLCSLGPTLAQL